MTTLGSSALATGLAAFLYAAVVGPSINAYSRWKNDPSREIVYRKNLFGRLVPDLRRKRIERALWLVLAAFFVIGQIILWAMMHPQLGTVEIIIPKD